MNFTVVDSFFNSQVVECSFICNFWVDPLSIALRCECDLVKPPL